MFLGLTREIRYYKKIISEEIKDKIVLDQAPKPTSRKKFRVPFLFFLLLIVLGIIIGLQYAKNQTQSLSANKNFTTLSTPTPKIDQPFGMYSLPKIPKKDVYRIFMVGDSMTEELGPHGGKFSEFINTLYQSTPGHQRIVVDNYAVGSTNILGLQEAMTQKLQLEDSVLDPLLSRQFDLILIESFGYNPLSQLGITEGIKKQTQTLDQIMQLITKTHPGSAIVFVATIAPNKETYAKKASPDKTVSERIEQANERIEYIKNHMAYAKSHSIPLIDIFDKSLTVDGDGDIVNINPNDNIHPSFKGIDFISQEIANFIYENQILPR